MSLIKFLKPRAAGKCYELEQYRKLKGKLKHFCPDWDMMAIDETSPEMEGCTCNFVNKFREQIKRKRTR